MNTNALALAAGLSDEALVAKVKLLTERSRAATVELIAHLGELAARRLHCAEGTGTLFAYCTQVLRFSEAAAWNRIKSARAARRFPVILDLLADGSVNMTTIRLIAPHLTAENHAALLAEATGMTRRQTDKLVARLAPKPDVPASVRKVPAPVPPTVSLSAPAALALAALEPEPAHPTAVHAAEPVAVPAAKPPLVTPTSPDRYRIQFTVGQETEELLRRLQDLLRREIPDGDPGKIVARALPLLLREVEKTKCAMTDRPRPARPSKDGTRHPPAAIARAVWSRDESRCAYVAANGRRCTERSFLEIHHGPRPYAHGGEMTLENLALRCRAHNDYEARLIFGPYVPAEVRETHGSYWSPDQ